ncbi:MAG TPA: glutathione S-transferase [Polyangiales bacterium]|nr:glutathione S-transferase [Polyangiales bacterium]
MEPIKLYRHKLSGHSHRVEVLLSLLGLPSTQIDVDVLKGEQKAPDFLRKNPLGQVPVIEDGNVVLADSNAIMVYLATRYDESRRWYPREAVPAAEVQRWLSVATGELRYGPGNLRLLALLKAPIDKGIAERQSAQLMPVLESALAQRAWLVGEHATIADVAIYTYSALAPEGGVSLEPYPSLRAWHRRFEALPGFVPMPRVG